MEVDFYQLLREEMLPIIESTMISVRQKIDKNNRKFCMEIFGYEVCGSCSCAWCY